MDFFDIPPPGQKPTQAAPIDPVQVFVPPPPADPVAALVDPMAAIVASLPVDPARAEFTQAFVDLVREGKASLTAEQRLYLLETIPGFPEADRTEIELRQLIDCDLMEVANTTWEEADRNALAAAVQAEQDAAKEV